MSMTDQKSAQEVVAQSQPPALLEVRDLRVAFGSKEVVHGVSFSMSAGEKLALVGESGSGKTVTALSLLRLVGNAQITGSARLDGLELLSLPEQKLRAIRGNEIAMIFQEPMTALNPLMSIGEQIAEVLELKQGLSKKQAWPQAVELLANTGLAEPARRAAAYPHQISGGQRQRAMIAMALASQPKLLLADEPTTALDVTLRTQILELLGDLQRQTGMALLLITHDLHLVQKFADRAVVMEHGHLVEQAAVEDLFAAPKHPYTQKLLSSTPKRDVTEINSGAASPDLVVSAQHLQVAYPTPLAGLRGWFRQGEFVAVKDAAFALHAGRTLGVVGESGSGKSTLAQAVLGLLRSSGELKLFGQSWQLPASRNTASNQALRQQVQVVFQDPFSSLSPRLTIGEIVGEGLRVHEQHLPVEDARRQVESILTEVGMSQQQFPGLLDRYPHEFSGGQRQRIAIARALIVSPSVLILDEPTSALDVTIQQQVLSLLQRLQKARGLAYLLITHDMDVIRAMAHEVLVMKDGEIVEQGEALSLLRAPTHSYTQKLVAAAH